MTHFAFPAEMALVRLDGQYGDAAVVAQIMLANVHVVTRGKGYQLLEHPQLQRKNGMSDTQGQGSEVARLLRQIREEYESAQQGIAGLAFRKLIS